MISAKPSTGQQQVRATFRGRVETVEVLDRFWLLQDALARVVEALHDHSHASAVPCTGLVERVVGVLEEVESFDFSFPAVKSACAAVNRSLLALEQSKGKLRGEGAAEFFGGPKKSAGLASSRDTLSDEQNSTAPKRIEGLVG